MKKRKGGYSRRPMPSYKRIVDSDFIVDGFQHKCAAFKSYFLRSLCWHKQGLQLWHDMCVSNFYPQPTDVGSQIARKLPHGLYILYSALTLNNAEVILLPANHCPGAAMFLFRIGDKYTLHVGDFRYDPSMQNYEELSDIHINTLYLDTTFCNPKYRFPPKEVAAQMVVDIVLREMSETTLFLIGTYTIGKEDVYCSVARVCNRKAFVNIGKYSMLQCLDISDLEEITTTDASKTNIHVVPMGHVSFNKMRQLYNFFNGRYTRIIGFHPTGWTGNDLKKEQSGHALTIYHVPYSEHSNYYELIEFVSWLRPSVLIPTVNADSESKVKETMRHFEHLLTGPSNKASIHSFLYGNNGTPSTLRPQRKHPPSHHPTQRNKKPFLSTSPRAAVAAVSEDPPRATGLFAWLRSVPSSLMSTSFSSSSPALPTSKPANNLSSSFSSQPTVTSPSSLRKSASSPLLTPPHSQSSARYTHSPSMKMYRQGRVHSGNRIIRESQEEEGEEAEEKEEASLSVSSQGVVVYSKEEEEAMLQSFFRGEWDDSLQDEQIAINEGFGTEETEAKEERIEKEEEASDERREVKKEEAVGDSMLERGGEKEVERGVEGVDTQVRGLGGMTVEKEEEVVSEGDESGLGVSTMLDISDFDEKSDTRCESFVIDLEDDELKIIDPPTCPPTITATTITTTATTITTSTCKREVIDLTLEEEATTKGNNKRPLLLMLGGSQNSLPANKRKKLNLGSKKGGDNGSQHDNNNNTPQHNKRKQPSILAALFGFTSQKRATGSFNK